MIVTRTQRAATLRAPTPVPARKDSMIPAPMNRNVEEIAKVCNFKFKFKFDWLKYIWVWLVKG